MIKNKTTVIEEPCGTQYETLKEKRKKKLKQINNEENSRNHSCNPYDQH